LSSSLTRPDPDRLLRQIEAEERYQRRGRLKVFLGYASGVGKSYRMLDEGRRRKQRGQDVVIGALQGTVAPEVACVLKNLETIPVAMIDGVPAMDLPAILRRRPQVCLVDGLAYDNPPGYAHAKRWQDVERLLDAGISVITTVNLQYIGERQDEVERIAGRRAAFSVPMSFVKTADEIVVVDSPTENCLRSEGESGFRTSSPYTEQQLSQLRELSLLLAAEVVDHQLESYLERNGIEQLWGTQERILVLITPSVNAAALLESGRRNRERFHGELHVAYSARCRLETILDEARSVGATIQELPAEDTLEFILQFAHTHGITQIFVGQSKKSSWRERFYKGLVDRLIESADGIDIQVFPS
jgi:two-component system sensor histidine kinase KdpD